MAFILSGHVSHWDSMAAPWGIADFLCLQVVFQIFAESPGLLSGPVSVNSWRINFYFTIMGDELDEGE